MAFVDGEGTEHKEVWAKGFYGNKYNPPKTNILEDYVRATWGWFFPEAYAGEPGWDPSDEPACYIDIYFNENGKPFVTLDYGSKFLELDTESIEEKIEH